MTTSNSSPSSSASEPVVVGIDVAKDKLDIARSDTARLLTVPNSPEGFNQLLEALAGVQVKLVVLESTGGLERHLIAALLEAGLPTALVQPGRVRHFAKSEGLLAKTDALDAALLVKFGQKATVRLLEKKPENRQLLADLLTCRRQLVESRAIVQTQLQTTVAKPATAALRKVLNTTDEQIKKLDRQIQKLIDDDEHLGPTQTILQSVPGVGPVLAATLLARLAELGTTGRNRIAALVGVAPYPDDSNKRTGKRFIQGGRQEVRNILYMATLTAMRVNDRIKAFAERLQAKNKPFKLVVTACMHKLLTILNALVRDGTIYQPAQAPVTA